MSQNTKMSGRRTLRPPEELVEWGLIEPAERAGIERVVDQFAIAISPAVLANIGDT